MAILFNGTRLRQVLVIYGKYNLPKKQIIKENTRKYIATK